MPTSSAAQAAGPAALPAEPAPAAATAAKHGAATDTAGVGLLHMDARVVISEEGGASAAPEGAEISLAGEEGAQRVRRLRLPNPKYALDA